MFYMFYILFWIDFSVVVVVKFHKQSWGTVDTVLSKAEAP